MGKSARTAGGGKRAGKRSDGGTGRSAGKKTQASVGRRRVGKKTSRRLGTRKAGAQVQVGEATKALRKLGARDGCAGMLVVAERVGKDVERVSKLFGGRASASSDGRGAVGKRKRAGAKAVGRVGRVATHTCRALAAVGHSARAGIMGKLLEGPCTYRALQRVTGLKAGPLYHHVNQLRLAGLILPKQRDLYELTRGGRNLIVAVVLVGPLIKDARRRPVPPDEST